MWSNHGSCPLNWEMGGWRSVGLPWILQHTRIRGSRYHPGTGATGWVGNSTPFIPSAATPPLGGTYIYTGQTGSHSVFLDFSSNFVLSAGLRHIPFIFGLPGATIRFITFHSFCSHVHSKKYEKPISPLSNPKTRHLLLDKMASMKIASLLAAATLVAGHGYVTNATIGGTSCESFKRPNLPIEMSLESVLTNVDTNRRILSALYRSVHEPYSRPSVSTYPGQWTCGGCHLVGSPVRW